jgi:hypothetical protein
VANGGLGGGGKGAGHPNMNPSRIPNPAGGGGESGLTNTGGGGGGGYGANGGTSNGGSGAVLVRYEGPQTATGGTITSSDGFTIHTFTGGGTFATNSDFGTVIVDSGKFSFN